MSIQKVVITLAVTYFYTQILFFKRIQNNIAIFNLFRLLQITVVLLNVRTAHFSLFCDATVPCSLKISTLLLISDYLIYWGRCFYNIMHTTAEEISPVPQFRTHPHNTYVQTIFSTLHTGSKRNWCFLTF
jgi:hypothetical protein